MHASFLATLVLVAASAIAPVLSTPNTVRGVSDGGALVARDVLDCPYQDKGACVGTLTGPGNGEP